MSARLFVPWVEQLESRLLLTVMTDVVPYVAAGSGLIEAAAISTHQVDSDFDVAGDFDAVWDFDVVVHSADTAAGHVLVVELKNLDQPRTVGILGGDLARTDADGTVQLRQPPNIRSLELTISDANGRQYSFLRVELDGKGHVVNQTPIAMEMLSAPEHNSFHGTTDQLTRLHGNTAHNLSSPVDSMSDQSGAKSSHAMDVRTFDEVLTHYGMPSMPTMTPYNSLPNHAAMMPVESTAPPDEFAETDSPNEHRIDDSEATPIQLAMATPEMADDVELDEFAEVPIEDAEIVDAALVNWQSDVDLQPENGIANPQAGSGPHGESSQRIEQATIPVFHTIAAVAEEPLELTSVGVPEESSGGSMLPSISSCLLAIACAAGVFVLERKANKKKSSE